MHVAAAERHAGLSLSRAGDFEGGVLPWSPNFLAFTALRPLLISGLRALRLPIDLSQTSDCNFSSV
jgi:hypothetical protein